VAPLGGIGGSAANAVVEAVKKITKDTVLRVPINSPLRECAHVALRLKEHCASKWHHMLLLGNKANPTSATFGMRL